MELSHHLFHYAHLRFFHCDMSVTNGFCARGQWMSVNILLCSEQWTEISDAYVMTDRSKQEQLICIEVALVSGNHKTLHIKNTCVETRKETYYILFTESVSVSKYIALYFK